jgi:LytS/YehU family sensor histidine kinase
MIPPGIIEPILENAVNHAFTGVRYKGKILLRHRIENNKLLIVVEDNGIGFKTSSLIEKKSHGLKITKDHIKIISKLYNSNIKLNIKSNKKGTYVEITIPKLNKLER